MEASSDNTDNIDFSNENKPEFKNLKKKIGRKKLLK